MKMRSRAIENNESVERGDLAVKQTKRISGILILLLGIAGIVVCLAGIAVTWTVRNRLDDVLAKTLSRVDVGLTRLEDRVEGMNDRIQGVHDALHQLDDRVQQRVSARRNIPKEKASIDQIERQLYARFQLLKAWIEFSMSTVDLVEQLMEIVTSTSAFLQDDSHTTRDLLVSIQSGHEEIDEASRLLDDVQNAVIEIRAKRNIQENARQITMLSTRIDASLTKIKGYGE
jgi:septation ring formation regulator EzrA